jgi:hypothetical protein
MWLIAKIVIVIRFEFPVQDHVEQGSGEDVRHLLACLSDFVQLFLFHRFASGNGFRDGKATESVLGTAGNPRQEGGQEFNP